MQKRAQGILQAEGFQVETVSNGVAAIKKLPNLQPVLVLADVSMPGKNGYEVCEYIKTSADFRRLPVLLMASDLEPYDEQRGAHAGADGIIKKPYTPHELIAMVAKFVAPVEAAAPASILSDTLVGSVPVTPRHATPEGSEPDVVIGDREQALAASAAGVGSAGPPLDEIPAAPPAPEAFLDVPLAPAPEPSREISPQPSPEQPFQGLPEKVFRGPSEPIPRIIPEVLRRLALELTRASAGEPILGAGLDQTPAAAEVIGGSDAEGPLEPAPTTPEPIPRAISEVVPERAPGAPELISQTALEAMPEPILGTILQAALEPIPAAPQSISGVAAEAVPEQRTVAPESAAESGFPMAPESAPETIHPPVEAVSGQAMPAPEPAAESGFLMAPGSTPETIHPPAEAVPEAPPAPMVEVPSLTTEHILGEKQPEAPPPPSSLLERVEAAGDRPMAAPAIAEIAEPLLIDELAAPSAVLEPQPCAQEHHPQPIEAASLDGFSLTQGAEGQVYVGPPETHAASAPRPEAAQPVEAPGAIPAVIDPRLVFVIVQKAVLKMSPPALPLEVVEGLVRRLAAEITAELDAESS
jgi:CheY-like chemotaxis protein